VARRIATVIITSLAFAPILIFAAPAAAANQSASQKSSHGRRARATCRKQTSKRHRRQRGCAVRVTHRTADRITSISGGLVVGLNADVAGWGGDSTIDRLSQVRSKTGTKWLREEFLWSTIEPSRGSFDFSYYDHFMLIAAQHGMHVLAVVDGTPSWAGATDNTVPADASGYAQYVAALIARYGSNGSFWNAHPDLRGSAIGTWELWNEPYYASNYAPARYANLVKATAIAGHAVDPTAKFLLSAEMQSARDSAGNWLWWDDALYRAVPDLNKYFDGVAIHPYGRNTTGLNPMIAGKAYANYDHVRRAEDIHQQFIKHGAGNKPFWITEAGWSTCTDNSDCVNASQQATDLNTLFGYLHGSWKSWIQAAFIYRYGDGANPSTMQDGYGLSNLNGSPKPALAIFAREAAAGA
jgi:polysaccharide biosynthesis protein PslG